MMRTSLLALPLSLVLAGQARAQALEGAVGQFYEDAGWTLYRVGMSRPLVGPLGLSYQGSYLTREGDGDGAFAGVGTDLTAFRGGAEGPYLVAGLAGGVGSPHSNDFSSFWGSWSAGAGYELFPLSVLAFTVEGRWRELSVDARDGFELAAGLSVRFGGGGRRGEPVPPQPLAPLGLVETLRDSVVAAATEAMGRPYRYGGTGADGGGFDCSGLIQYAYGKHGVTLPRTSAEQAREGKKIAKKVPSLAPGDLLTFSNRGGKVTHVGMYLGDRRFVHSATRGVQVSLLSKEDPYGRWWYSRWVGARRIVNEKGERLGD
ncbi:MAG: C40 family peptidase [Gemmatimonadales bacterium]|nr:C40 family peptidase [Gemmatimonadales bacterium]